MHEHKVLYLLIGKLVYRWEETKIRNYLKHISSLHWTKQSDDNVLGGFTFTCNFVSWKQVTEADVF